MDAKKILLYCRRSVGGLYYLSYLDNNMLLGRSVGGGGVFVFTKSQPLELWEFRKKSVKLWFQTVYYYREKMNFIMLVDSVYV